MARTPLAWKNLVHSPPRLVVSLSSVGFAVVLMFMQTGFRNALFDSTVQPLRELRADLIVRSRARYTLSRTSQFPLSQLGALEAVPGVESARPLYIELLFGVLRSGERKGRPIRVFAFQLDDCPFDNDGLTAQLDALRRPGSALFDSRSKSNYRVDLRALGAGRPQRAELNGRELALVGLFELGTDFANDGNLVMGSESFADFFPMRSASGGPLDAVDLGLIRCAPGADVDEVRRRVAQALPKGLEVFTRQRLIDDEIRFWARSTPVGVVFLIGTIMGFVVGVIICYQVIYTDISDHMAELATLKAMGYSNLYFVGLVVRQAVYLSLMGFVPGLLVSWGLYNGLASATGLLMELSFVGCAMILALTIVMCVLSGAIALRKLISADPASLF